MGLDPPPILTKFETLKQWAITKSEWHNLTISYIRYFLVVKNVFSDCDCDFFLEQENKANL